MRLRRWTARVGRRRRRCARRRQVERARTSPRPPRARQAGRSSAVLGEIGAILGEQPDDVDDPDPFPRGLFGQPLRHHFPADHVQHADAGRAGAEHHDLLLRKRATGNLRGTVQCTDGDRGGALDVVVEGQQLVAVAGQDRLGVRGGEVLPLQQHVRQLLLHRGDEFVDERVVVVVVDPTVTPAEVLGVVEEFDVVGADVEHDRQGARGVDAADEGVQRELADRDAHPADALVA